MNGGWRVLVVDDDDTFRQFTAGILRASGYAIDEAKDGAVAIEKLRTSTPDLLLLDLCMPVVDGWGVLEHIREQKERPRVVVVSGVREVVPPGNLGSCITAYLFKPFRASQLLEMCDGILARPLITPTGDNRREPRRTFLADATVLAADRTPLSRGLLVEVSAGGVRLQLEQPVRAGDTVIVLFSVPGQPYPVQITGEVRWADASTMGAEVVTGAGDDVVLRALVDLA